LPTGSADQGITADLYPEVANSLDFRMTIAEEPLEFRSIRKRLSTVEYFRDHQPKSAIGTLKAYTIGLPERIQNLVSNPESNTGPLRPTTIGTLPAYDGDYLKLVNELQGRLTISFDKKTSVITITARMPDKYASADIVRVTSERLMERIIDLEVRKAGEHFAFIAKQHGQAQERFERAQRALAVYADRNRVLTAAVSQIERDRLQSEHDLALEVYQQFSRELEQARIKMNQDTPIFSVLERVTVPSERSSPKRKQTVLLALFLGVIGGLVWIGLRQLLDSSMRPSS
jgi:uncharacterized protein involved in exopolysaccharide biosynthesis